MATKNVNLNIIAKDKSKQALQGVQKRLGNVKNAVFSLRGALVGLGAGAVIKGFVDVGKEVESLQVRFKFLFGSVEEGSKAFDNLAKFAGTVPFSLEEISRASGNLAVVAKDAILKATTKAKLDQCAEYLDKRYDENQIPREDYNSLSDLIKNRQEVIKNMTVTESQYFTTEQLASRYGMHPDSIRRWRYKGYGPEFYELSLSLFLMGRSCTL